MPHEPGDNYQVEMIEDASERRAGADAHPRQPLMGASGRENVAAMAMGGFLSGKRGGREILLNAA
ncbi:MAG: hypothetical protein OXU20_30470 [Myxococcales bacterium]|nr:hypothetical protein [Myxococcales bacterium]